MRKVSSFRKRCMTAVVIALGGGTLFGGCETRVKDAIVQGATGYILSPAIPGQISACLDADPNTTSAFCSPASGP